MMAGAGVSVGGAGMLRTRRRDVSVKPNRKLDRKSSRGMIYENEELRLRTIHINAEVEQGQNDIKKLRRENEQLRREIWSLRDEYDKLEEILKRQKNQEESEEYEDRSEEDDALHSDYSCEEDEEAEEDGEENGTGDEREEQLENAENQKISSEKMNNSVHRLHVDFDDLSVVEEEEELKKERERKESTQDENQGKQEGRSPLVGPRQLHENIPFYPATYEPSTTFSGSSYCTDCPFEFPNRLDPILAADSARIYDPLIPLTGLDRDQILPPIHAPPVGWQNNIVSDKQLSSYSMLPTLPLHESLRESPRVFVDSRATDISTLTPPQPPGAFSTGNDQLPRKNLNYLSPLKFPSSNPFEVEMQQQQHQQQWNFASPSEIGAGKGEAREGKKSTDSSGLEGKRADPMSSSERPKHFFAPLPSKLKKQPEEESPTASTIHFGTGTSSSSGKTGSTVISRSTQSVGQKGSADIYVNGAIPYAENARRGREEQKTFLSSDNLLIDGTRSSIAGSQPVKSMSCQDLSTDFHPMNISERLKMNRSDDRPQITKSDNTLDNIPTGQGNTPGRPYKTHLNVTLKVPRHTPSPETPEIPKLPSIDYRLFKNPFLRKFDPSPGYVQSSPVTRPLSIHCPSQDANLSHYPSPPCLPAFSRALHFEDKYQGAARQDQRLLIPSDQLLNGKQDIQVTSFERPSPHTLLPSAIPYDIDAIRRMTTNRYLQGQNLYQNLPPFIPRTPLPPAAHLCPQRAPLRLYYDNLTTKVPAQTQTSIDGDSHLEDDQSRGGASQIEEEPASAPNSPSGQRRKRVVKKERSGTLTRDGKPLSPAAQRRLRKQSSVTSSEIPESPGKPARHRPRKLSITTTTTSDAQEDKNESRSSSSGQDSPRKDQIRRVSIHFNAKKRPSLSSVKTTRSLSLDNAKDKYLDSPAVNAERERTNSISSREMANTKARKGSTSSGSVPWCACWGNGCL